MRCLGTAALVGVLVAVAQPPLPPPCSAHANALTIVAARGASNYAFGVNVGRATRLQVAARLAAREATAALAFAATPPGTALVAALLANANATFPRFVEELVGLAAGAAVLFSSVFVLNVMDELEVLMPPWPPGPGAARSGHCTDILVGPPTQPRNGPRLLAHNEDAEVSELGLMFLLEAADVPLADGSGGLFAFTAFMYAGMLASEAFAYNDAGVFFTTNALFPIAVDDRGVPRSFVQRHVLEARSVSDAAARLDGAAVACGFAMNLGGLGSALAPGVSSMRNVELSSRQLPNSYDVGLSQHYYHANKYLRAPTPQFDDVSSDARIARLQQLPAPQWPNGVADAERMLSDEVNASFPIFRSGAGADCCTTVMTALVEVVFDAAIAQEVGTLSLLPNRPSECPTPIVTRTFMAPEHKRR